MVLFCNPLNVCRRVECAGREPERVESHVCLDGGGLGNHIITRSNTESDIHGYVLCLSALSAPDYLTICSHLTNQVAS